MDNETKKYLEEQFSRLATKEDLAVLESRMATKEDLASLESRTKEDLAALEARKKADLGEVIQSIQALATHIDERFDELTPITSRVENHEKRIVFLEDKLPKLA
jgi:hypothetical protein